MLIALAVALAGPGDLKPAKAQASQSYRLEAAWDAATAPSRIAMAPSGDSYVIASGGTRVEWRAADGVVMGTMQVVGAQDLAVDDVGSVYTVNGHRAFWKYGANGNLVWSDSIAGFGPILTPTGERPPYVTGIAWNPVLEQITAPYDFGGFLDGGSEFRMRIYTKGGVVRPGFAVQGTTDTYGDAAALGSDIYLINRTRATVEVYRNGAFASQFALHEPADRLAVGPDGSVFALARERWIYKYSAAGAVLAAWDGLDVSPDPFADSIASDIAVDSSGRVLVTDPGVGQIRVYNIDPDPNAEPGPAPSPPDLGCQVFPDKFADPTRLRLGESTEVTLRLDGGCPEVSERADIVLVVDISGSMQGEKLVAAKSAIETFLALKDVLSPPGRDHVALVSFDTTARLNVPLTADSGAVLTAARALVADGGTNIAAGIDTALTELTGANRRVDAQPIIVLMTDGRPTAVTGAESLAAADRARTMRTPSGCRIEGTCDVRLYAIGLGTDLDQDFMRILATTPDLYYFAPGPAQLADVYETIARRIYATELLKTVVIVDRIPDNMTYVLDSAVPPATYDPAAHSLTWTLSNIGFAGTQLRYRLIPEEVGQWPTNIIATFDGDDGLGEPQMGVFPIPIVIVEAETPTPTASRPPTITPTDPPSPTVPSPTAPSPTPTSTNTPSPTSPSPTPSATPTEPPTSTPSATPERHSIYVVVLYNNVCFKRYADVTLVIDASTTMLRKDETGNRTKLEAARSAARAFLDDLTLVSDARGRSDQAAIVWFNDTASVEQPLTHDRSALDRALDRIQPVEGSRIDLGLRKAHEAVLDAGTHDTANTPVVVLLSDGIPNRTTFDEVFAAADALKHEGALLFSVGYGLDVEAWALKRIASQPEYYRYAPTTRELESIYRQVAGEVVCR